MCLCLGLVISMISENLVSWCVPTSHDLHCSTSLCICNIAQGIKALNCSVHEIMRDQCIIISVESKEIQVSVKELKSLEIGSSSVSA